jgi:acyl carrier protein
MDETAKEIETFIVEEITGEQAENSLRHDEDLLSAELIDSLGITELVTFLEGRFGIKVDDADLTADNFRTIDAIAALVVERGRG